MGAVSHEVARLVSIHAPARGATKSRSFFPWLRNVSIHAPARGATHAHDYLTSRFMFQSTLPHGERLATRRSEIGHLRFNPRSRTGSDKSNRCSEKAGSVSIHAPARGATPASLPTGTPGSSFNPRSRTGSDSHFFPPELHQLSFQSTLPHGERRSPRRAGGGRESFNPRSRTGSDPGG